MPPMNDQSLTSEQHYYAFGCCHIFAAAALEFFEEHGIGGHFLVFSDPEELYYEGEDGDDDVPAIVHVYAVIETSEGTRAVDIFGMHPEEDAAKLAKDRYLVHQLEEDRVPDRAAMVEYFVQLDDEDDDLKPLSEFDESDIADAKEIVRSAYLDRIDELRPRSLTA